jgi:hypothetical protein
MQLYRLGRTQTGKETCTPRLLAVDLKENMIALNPEQSSLFRRVEAPDVLAAWAGPMTTVTAEPMVKNSFQQLLDREETLGEGDERESYDGIQDK